MLCWREVTLSVKTKSGSKGNLPYLAGLPEFRWNCLLPQMRLFEGMLEKADGESANQNFMVLFAVNAFLHFFANFEIRKLLFPYLYYLSCLWITSLIAIVTFDFKAAEASDFYPVSLGKRVGHGVKNHIHHAGSILDRNTLLFSNAFDELTFVHPPSSPLDVHPGIPLINKGGYDEKLYLYNKL